jgi:hypothetical protein
MSKQDLIKINATNKGIASRYYDYKIINESYLEVITKTLNNRVSL